MKKIGIGIDYSNICKEYNTAYLDRDNKDPATTKCMNQVLSWAKKFLSELLEEFDYRIYSLNSDINIKVDDVAAKRFLFYSLEKEITLQSFVMQKQYIEYGSLGAWEQQEDGTVLIQNEEDGGSVIFFVNEDSKEHIWIMDKLKAFSLDEVVFKAVK